MVPLVRASSRPSFLMTLSEFGLKQIYVDVDNLFDFFQISQEVRVSSALVKHLHILKLFRFVMSKIIVKNL